jgi:hypothetical protein
MDKPSGACACVRAGVHVVLYSHNTLHVVILVTTCPTPTPLSWGDLIILAGNVALESMMGRWGTVDPIWFGGGRVDAFAPEEDVYWVRRWQW